MNETTVAEPRRMSFAGAAGFGLIDLATASPLRVQLLPSGAIFAFRHGPTLINQLISAPVDDGLFRLLLRWHGDAEEALSADGRTTSASSVRNRVGSDPHPDDAEIVPPFSDQRQGQTNQLMGWARLVGAGLAFETTASGAVWRCTPLPGLHCETRLQLHATLPAWSWHIKLHNASLAPFALDVLHAQDLGLADEAAVRNNEAYVSHYIDLYPVRDHELGWTLLARQNQRMAGGHHPWLGVACASGAAEYCTDGWQFFGPDHRLTGVPAAVRATRLPSHVFQYEAALAGLQSQLIGLKPGADAEVTFIARFVEDHPGASSADDVELIRALIQETAVTVQSHPPFAERAENVDDHETAIDSANRSSAPLFVQAPWLHGDTPTIGDWDAWFHGPRRHQEFSRDDSPLSFFHGPNTHVVAREKEAIVFRPHGHILRSGDSQWFDPEHFGLTCYAAGIFGAQAYLGHPSFARLLSVVRNALNVTRSSGQRAFVRRDGRWQQLGIPSAFVLKPGEVRWIYRFGDDVIGAHVWCARELSASFLALSVIAGPPCEFLITHELALGEMEFEHPGTVEFQSEACWVSCEPSRDSLVGQHQPDVAFAIACAEPSTSARVNGDGPLYADGADRNGPYVVLQTTAVERCGIILLGSSEGISSLDQLVTAARAVFRNGGTTSASSVPETDDTARLAGALGRRREAVPPSLTRRAATALPPESPVRLRGTADGGIARVNEVLPWFAHNASIHFSAPHGLEQYGGAAWGVRDVCQGSIEWLLTAGEFPTVRRILETVFAQQYPHDGSWPQWFMFPPYHFIQQAHSHGDVCFWPVKAVCDYVEATNDLAFLNVEIGYTDPAHFTSCGPQRSILEHCDLVIAQARARFFPGTALVNYGDGDWDDTLQPADPTMRTRMISAWTVALAFQTFRQLAEVCRRAGNQARAAVLAEMLASMRHDFAAHLMPGGVVAGFVFAGADGRLRPLLHPQDDVTGIRHRLLPMTRSILAELFTPEEAQQHLAIVAAELSYPDGVRLMSEPATYRGGLERWFKRAESAANVGREIGLQYVHAHLRYAESLAKVGDADGLWQALQVVNPVDLAARVPHATPRQSNAYFSSSDADFANRYEAAERWAELRSGRVAVRGGWRIYSSGPGLFLHAVRACLLGIRESFDDIVFDPVLPRALDGLVAEITLCDCAVELRYRVHHGTFAPRSLSVNGIPWNRQQRERNPYRPGGLLVPRSHLIPFLHAAAPNVIAIEL